MKRKVLGKGIEAIISNQPVIPEGSRIVEIDVDRIYPNPFQPRKRFKKEKIEELANSIKESGMIQPIVVFRENDKFYIYVGERRWRAAQFLKMPKISAVVKELSRDELLAGALVENIQREDLNAIEIAEGIELLINKNQLNQERAAEKLGMNRSTLANFLRLLKLPETVKQGIISGDLSPGHARTLLSLPNDDAILECYSTIQQKQLSVRQTETLVKNFGLRKKHEPGTYDPDVAKMEEKLTRALATKVKLTYSSKGSGKIQIFFNQLEEFERIFKIISKE